MSKTVCIFCAQTYLVKQVCNSFCFFFFAEMEMNVHSLGNNFTDCHTRVQRCIWVLENDLNILFELQKVLAFEGGDILTVKNNFTGCWLVELDHGTAAGGFSAAGLAYQTQCFSSFNADCYMVYRFQCLFASCFKELAQVGNFQDVVGVLQFFNYLIHYFASLS